MSRPFIIAEMSANHLGSLERALKIISVAKECGADAVKTQCWYPGSMCVSESVIASGPWKGRELRDLYSECETPWHWYPTMFAWAKSIGIELFASAFDIESIQFLEKMGVRRHKIASCELVDLRLVKAAARTGKPLILSTGMATYDEIKAAVYAADISTSNVKTTLLRCVSGYPAQPEEIGLGMIRKMSKDWLCKVGLSDHTPGTAVSVAAVALGATMIEKHLTLARADGGPDAGFSMEPHEFKQLVEDCQIASEAVKDVDYGPRPTEESQLALRRSLWWAKDMEPGSLIDQYSTKTARPSTGLNPILLPSIMGKPLSRAVRMNTPVLEVDLNG